MAIVAVIGVAPRQNPNRRRLPMAQVDGLVNFSSSVWKHFYLDTFTSTFMSHFIWVVYDHLTGIKCISE